ncbi:MAG: amidohydrolase [Planctomycetaceae bacterium]|nr:amidohydrolase [Planctomycetaceae bacterium]
MRPLILTIFVSLLLSFSPSTVLASAADEKGDRPNIIFFLIDDLGYADCGFNGGKIIRTPRIDELANSGAILTSHYVQPVCSPTRAALMTGRYATRTGVYTIVRPQAKWGLPLAERTLAQGLQQAGYETAITGKWHLGEFEAAYRPTARGFEHQYGHYFGAIDYFTHLRDGVHDWHRDDKEVHEEGYSTELVAKEACRLIEARKSATSKRPLFLYVPFNGVHSPFQVPERYMEPYPQLTGNRRKIAGMLAAVDEAIGQIVDTLRANGEFENTLIVFSADNGGPNPGPVSDNGPLKAAKGTLYEGGIRGCAFATWPGKIPAGQKIDVPVHVVDWYPTLLKLAGGKLEQPLPIDGQDLWPVLTKKAESAHDAILLVQSPQRAAVRMGDYKLLRLSAPRAAAAKKKKQAKSEEPVLALFNLKNDIGETRNLISEEPERAKKMEAVLDELLRNAVPPGNGNADENDEQAMHQPALDSSEVLTSVGSAIPTAFSPSEPTVAADPTESAVLESIEKRRDASWQMARKIWEAAEPGYQEVQSSKLLADAAEAAGLQVTRGVAEIPTAFTAEFGSGKPVIGILGEFDALPGLTQKDVPEQMPRDDKNSYGHGCGHHLFGVASLSAAIAVAEQIRSGAIKGTVRFYGCPAEEGGSAKVFMVQAGLFQDCDAVLHWHPASRNSAGDRSSLARIAVKFQFSGQTAHAAGSPHQGRSALDAIELTAHASELMREHTPEQTRIHHVITSGGEAPNVVPAFAEMYFYIRHPEAKFLKPLYQRLELCAKAGALATETELTIKYEGGIREIMPNRTLSGIVRKRLQQLNDLRYNEEERQFAARLQQHLQEPESLETLSLVENVDGTVGKGSTDVGDISWVVPTTGFSTACWVPGTPGHSWQAVAAGGTTIGEKGMHLAARTLATSALDLFRQPDVLQAASQELKERLGKETYESLMQPGQKAPLDYRNPPARK